QPLPKEPKPSFSTWRRFWSEPGFAIATIILAVAILIFIVAPVFAVLLRSFGVGTETLTFDYYTTFFQRAYYWEALGNSILFAVIITIIFLFLCINFFFYVIFLYGF